LDDTDYEEAKEEDVVAENEEVNEAVQQEEGEPEARDRGKNAEQEVDDVD
jgi:hypothetical protein